MERSGYGEACGGRFRLDLLTSPLFMVSLLALVANDHLFKTLVPGMVTGKLSDFAGVFAFTLFWSALLPAWRMPVSLAIAAAFAAWKLPVSQSAIDFWNAHVPLPIGRTSDPSDLLALVMVPLAVAYAARPARPAPARSATIALMFASVVAFGATSYRTPVDYDSAFTFAGTPSEFLAALRERGISTFPNDASPDSQPTEYTLDIPSTVCFDTIEARIAIAARDAATDVRLLQLIHRCPRHGDDRARLYGAFQSAVVQPLKLEPLSNRQRPE